jgi:hypothetical protein
MLVLKPMTVCRVPFVVLISGTVHEELTAGRSIHEALTAFRESANHPGTMHGGDEWLIPHLDHIQQLLSEPITKEESQALLDVLYKRRWMEELIQWLTDRPVTWEDFPTCEANLREERKRECAGHGDRHSDLKLVPDEFFPKISDSCPACRRPRLCRCVAFGISDTRLVRKIASAIVVPAVAESALAEACLSRPSPTGYYRNDQRQQARLDNFKKPF